MVQAIGANNTYGINAEYLRIMRDLLSLGIPPTGNQTKDTQRLSMAGAELVQRINNNETSNSNQSLGIQVINPVDRSEYAQRSEMEEQRLGATNIGTLNKVYFGL